jgi:2-succinyl-6-hydroxy-2,4-cyclohexadiene-1-carboxylate synthase
VRGTGPRVVLVHGFTQNAEAWGLLPGYLARKRQVLAVDLPGHGSSGAVRADLPETARLLGDAGGAADYVGYSLGGRVSLHLALNAPQLVRRLILIASTAGIESDRCRQNRRAADEALAQTLETPETPETPGGDVHSEEDRLERFLRRWLSGPLFRTLRLEDAELDARRRNTCAGLAASLRDSGTGTQEPLWDRLHELAMPVMVIAGTLDVRFVEYGKRLASSIGPNAHLSLVAGAGHACHLERPDQTARSIDAFLG